MGHQHHRRLDPPRNSNFGRVALAHEQQLNSANVRVMTTVGPSLCTMKEPVSRLTHLPREPHDLSGQRQLRKRLVNVDHPIYPPTPCRVRPRYRDRRWFEQPTSPVDTPVE